MIKIIWEGLRLLLSVKDKQGKVGKKWFRSKTIWTNGIVVLGLGINRYCGIELDAETTTGILAVVNLVLRLITKETTGLIEFKD